MGTYQLTSTPGAAIAAPQPARGTAPRPVRGAARQTARSRRPRGRLLLSIILTAIWIAPVATVVAWGGQYYLTPFVERPHSELHDLFKPSGTIGLGLGIVGTVLMLLGVGMYGLRKRVRLLGRFGELGLWLQLHIYLCTLGPVLILFHTAFRFGGLVSIGFWGMTVVAVSGLFGRYLYAHIPSTIHGKSKSLEALQAEQQELIVAIRTDFGTLGEEIEQVLATGPRRRARGFLHALALIMRHALSRRRRLKKINKLLSRNGSRARRGTRNVPPAEQPVYLRETLSGLVWRQVELEQRIVLLEPFRAVFKFWRIMHIPLTIVMFVIVVLHIAVALLLGYTWIF